jgi:hypothetical protein
MSRLALNVLFIAIGTAHAHFPFLVPDGPDNGKAVFSDSLKPDTAGVPVDRIASTKVVVLQDGKGVAVPLTLDKAANCYTFTVPGSGPRIAVGTTDYGVLQRGESKPFLLRYYAKAVFGGVPAPDKATTGANVPLELVPVVDAGKLRFKVLASGKPVAKTDVTVLVPGEAKSKVVATDDSGLTPLFETPGMYGAHARMTEMKSGEQGGKKYEEVRHYATLVVAVNK